MSPPGSPRLLGLYLWRSGLMEQVGAGVFFKLARWARLDPADRRQAQVFGEEELVHAELLLGLGRACIPVRPDADLHPYRIPAAPAVALALVHQAERLTLEGFRRMQHLGRVIGHPELVAAYQRIEADERPHLAWGHRLLGQLRQDPATRQAIRTCLAARPVSRRFRLVAADRPWVAP